MKGGSALAYLAFSQTLHTPASLRVPSEVPSRPRRTLNGNPVVLIGVRLGLHGRDNGPR